MKFFKKSKQKHFANKVLMLGWVSIQRWEPLLSDYLMIAEKLEQLGFTYYRGKVTVIDPEEQK